MPQRSIRHRNATRIFHAIRVRPGATQREIVGLADADKSTVSTVLREFEKRHLIERIEIPSSGGRGRPSEGYRIADTGGVVVGIHLRPREIRLVLADMSGSVRGVLSRPLSPAPEFLGRDMAAGINGLLISAGLSAGDLKAVGLAVPGFVETSGLVRVSPNLGWSNFNPLALLQSEVSCPVFAGNNADGATLAELLFGCPPDDRSFVLMLSGSGVGGGIVLNGALVRGDQGMAGEMGHHKIERGGRLCRCGARGCLSAYVSSYALIEIVSEAGFRVESLTDVIELTKADNPRINGILREYSENLAIGISNIVTITGIGDVLFSGGFSTLLPHISRQLDAALDEHDHPAIRGDIHIAPSVTASPDVPLAGVAIALEGCTGLEAVEIAPWADGPRRRRRLVADDAAPADGPEVILSQ